MIRQIVLLLLIASSAACKKKPADSTSSGVPECEAYFKAMDKFATCPKLPPDQQKVYKDANDRMRADLVGPKDKTAALEQCKGAMSDLVAGAKDRGCALE